MVYLVIKELARDQDNVFVVINCLSKDMTSNNDVFRSNAIRVFAKVIDASMLGTMDRFLKQAIVDRNPAVSSAALIAGQQLFRIAPDVIRRWQNEIQEAVNSKSKMVQYHAFALLCLIKQHDRLALSKVRIVTLLVIDVRPLSICVSDCVRVGSPTSQITARPLFVDSVHHEIGSSGPRSGQSHSLQNGV